VTMSCSEPLPNTYFTTVHATGGGKARDVILLLVVSTAQMYSLSANVSPAGAGTLTASPPGGWYTAGMQVTATATANAGYTFTGFSGSLTGGSPGTVTMNGNSSVTANFTQTGGSLSVSCSATPGTATVIGQVVTFTASVSGGSPPYSFSWSGAVSGTSSSASFVPQQPGGYEAAVTVNQSITARCRAVAVDAALAEFRACIGRNGSGTVCQLAPGTHIVPPPPPVDGEDQDYLIIERSGLTVTGTMVSGPADTTLRRGNWVVTAGGTLPRAERLMTARSGVTNVTVNYFLFDGNRYGAYEVTNGYHYGLACMPGNSYHWDLDLNSGGAFTVQWVDFINAPGDALSLGGSGSSVSLSNFGQGGWGIGPGGGAPRTETPRETATRSTAIRLEGNDNGAWYNHISFAGTAGITLGGLRQYAYGNLLQGNRYEVSDGSGGGQIFVSPASDGASVVGNVMDGLLWPPVAIPVTTPALETQCAWLTPGQQQYNVGVEGYGFRHGFYNNAILNQTGSGMQFAASDPTGQITISSANPWDATDPPRFIEANQLGGIAFLGPQHCAANPPPPGQACYAAVGVSLDDVLVMNNRTTLTGSAVVLDGVSDHVSSEGRAYRGFINGACMSGNVTNTQQPANVPVGINSLTYPVPDTYASFRGGACPATGSTVPAPSYRTGWPW
jgi:hypothetical protein